MPKHLFKIIFEDGSDPFYGGESIHSSRWLEIPDRPIKRLEYFISNGEGIILENFEAYFCFVEAETRILGPVGFCPHCGKKGKISKKVTKYTNNETKTDLIARCTECTWIGKIQDLENKCNCSGDKYIYIMGLKNNEVTSYRVSLNGKSGESKYVTGDITKRIRPFGQVYGGRPTNRKLWKKGIN